tara:strand:+ start:500 stop:829 length:330 start_codon:yes stop_codon:yes gene_type:complete
MRQLKITKQVTNMEDSNLYDVMGNDSPNPDAQLMLESLKEEIRRSLSTLTPREADVITYHLGLNGGQSKTMEEVSEKFDLTKEKIIHIKEKAKRWLKQNSRNKILKKYL